MSSLLAGGNNVQNRKQAYSCRVAGISSVAADVLLQICTLFLPPAPTVAIVKPKVGVVVEWHTY